MEALTPVTQNVTLPGNVWLQELEESRRTPPEEGMALPTPSFRR